MCFRQSKLLIVRIGKQKFRSHLDTGAECSLMHRRVNDELTDRPKLVNKIVCLHSASGSEFKCDSSITVQVCVGTEMS